MTFEELTTVAKNINEALKPLKAKKLSVCAHAHNASSVQPKDYILIEGIKNLHSTGSFTSADRTAIDSIINKHVKPLNGEVKAGRIDPCMCIRIITI